MKNIKSLFTIAFIVCFAIAQAGNRAFILAGQSNPRGQGSPFLCPYTGEIPKVKIWDGDSFENLNGSVLNNNQFGQPQGTFGPEMSMAYDLQTLTGDTIWIIKYAIGATYLAPHSGNMNDWSPTTTGELFDSIITYINNGLALVPSNTIVEGFYFWQGEGDAIALPDADAYITNLPAFTSAVRTETNLPNLKFYIFRIKNITSNQVAPYSTRVRWAQIKYCYDDTLAKCIDTDPFMVECDWTHLTRDGYINAGEVAANYILQSQPEMKIQLQDDFAGTKINEDIKWNLTLSTTISQNNKLIFTNAHTSSITLYSRYASNEAIVNAGWIVVRAKVSWTDPQASQARGMFAIYRDSNNQLAFMAGASPNQNKFIVRTRVGGAITDTNVDVTNGADLKLKYNVTTHDYDASYWNGSQWVSVKSGNANLGAGYFKGFFTCNDGTTFTGGDTFEIDNFYSTIEDFSTIYPQ